MYAYKFRSNTQKMGCFLIYTNRKKDIIFDVLTEYMKKHVNPYKKYCDFNSQQQEYTFEVQLSDSDVMSKIAQTFVNDSEDRAFLHASQKSPPNLSLAASPNTLPPLLFLIASISVLKLLLSSSF